MREYKQVVALVTARGWLILEGDKLAIVEFVEVLVFKPDGIHIFFE